MLLCFCFASFLAYAAIYQALLIISLLFGTTTALSLYMQSHRAMNLQQFIIRYI